ncbi:MAG: DUF5809 family protein [Haloferacaceae archaeon]
MSDGGPADPTTEGHFAPATVAEAREQYESCRPAAKTVVRETARAMGVDRDEYSERVTNEVVETARDAVFASFLRVRVGSREAFEAWRAAYDGEVSETGSPDVDRVVWHVAPTGAVATTFHADREAAVGTLRRQAFGRLYRPAFEGGDTGEGAAPGR